MEKVQLSKVQKYEEYRNIIPFIEDGEEVYIYVRNPLKEELIHYSEKMQDFITGEDITREDIIRDMVETLTNIELDEDVNFESLSPTLTQVVYSLGEILDEIEISIYMQATIHYRGMIKQNYHEAFLDTYTKAQTLGEKKKEGK